MDTSSISARTFASNEVPRRQLQSLLRSGAIEQVSRGKYRRSDLPPTDLDLAVIAARSSRATICLASALAHYELIDEIPSKIDIALPRGSRQPKLAAPVAWHHFDTKTFELGRMHIALDGEDAQIAIYSAERSIVDAFRLRGYAGYEIGVEALTRWLERKGWHPAVLLQIAAQLPRASSPLATALNILT